MPPAVSASSNGRNGLIGTVAVKASNVSIRAMVGDTPIVVGPSVGKAGAIVRVEKPGFIFEYDLQRDLRVQFMNKIKLLNRQLEWAYSHQWHKETILDGSLAFNPSNKLSTSYSFPSSSTIDQSKSCKMKYKYDHSCGTSIEPSYDILKKTWGCVLSQRISDRIAIAARYDSSVKKLDLEWLYKSLLNKDGSFKVLASLDLSEGPQGRIMERIKKPEVWAENTWNFEL